MKCFLALVALLLIVGLPFLHYRLLEDRTRNFRAVQPQVMYRSGQMSPAGFEQMTNEYGIRTVISFRESRDPSKAPPDEFEHDYCREKGIVYHRLVPLRWSSPDGRIPAEANVERFLDIVKVAPRPILVHCFAGVHRTGAFVAIYRMECEGWNSEDAIKEMLAIGGLRSTFENDQIGYLSKYRRRNQ